MFGQNWRSLLSIISYGHKRFFRDRLQPKNANLTGVSVGVLEDASGSAKLLMLVMLATLARRL
jgi:hypothetical protein